LTRKLEEIERKIEELRAKVWTFRSLRCKYSYITSLALKWMPLNLEI
jgi:hypothetical protein